MPRVQRPLLVAGLLLLGLAQGCSSRAEPMKNGAPAAGKPVPINPANTKKFIQPEPIGPAAPPIKK